MNHISCGLILIAVVATSLPLARSAEPAAALGDPERRLVERPSTPLEAVAAPIELRDSHVLGAGDKITISVLGLKEIDNRLFEIGVDGTIDPLLIGSVTAAGITLHQLKQELHTRLLRVMKDPEVGISLTEISSRPVSVLGAVREPGVIQLKGSRRLAEVLSMAGGLREDAGHLLTISRDLKNGPLPLANASLDASEQHSIASIDIAELMENRAPEHNIVIRPDDVISVLKARLVYVVGDVARPGGFTLSDRDRISVMQALSMAEGLNRTAARKHAKIMRGWRTDKQTEVAIDLKAIMTGKQPDLALFADDVLFIPYSTTKSAAIKAIDSVIGLGTGLVVFH